MTKRAFDGVKVFCATLVPVRQQLGETVTRWLEIMHASRPGFQVVDIVVTQSSDAAYHMTAISIFYKEGRPSRG